MGGQTGGVVLGDQPGPLLCFVLICFTLQAKKGEDRLATHKLISDFA